MVCRQLCTVCRQNSTFWSSCKRFCVQVCMFWRFPVYILYKKEIFPCFSSNPYRSDCIFLQFIQIYRLFFSKNYRSGYETYRSDYKMYRPTAPKTLQFCMFWRIFKVYIVHFGIYCLSSGSRFSLCSLFSPIYTGLPDTFSNPYRSASIFLQI